MNGDLLGGKYSIAEIDEIYQMNKRQSGTLKPTKAFYQKSMGEIAPSYADKRELVTYLINDSNISPISKNYLRDCENWIPHYQYRGFKYGILCSSLTYCLMPVVRRQSFVRRFAFSMLPMFYMMKWGWTWGHENFWRRAKEVVVTYEILAGTRSKFTMK